MKESIFSQISKLANQNQAINLGQGFPDFDGPEFSKSYVTEAMNLGINQYAPLEGLKVLRDSICETFAKEYGFSLNPDKNITITSGASEAIFATILALVKPGDKVLAVDPIFDIYVAAVKMAGGILETVRCEEESFSVPVEEFQRAFKEKYKLIIINTPHNPSGYMWKTAEYKIFEDYLEKSDCYLLSDEVYEFLNFGQAHHSPFANDKIKSRVVKISSAGKTFGMTGWKIGWTAACEALSLKIRDVHQNIVYAVSSPMQYSIAKSLEHFPSYLPELRESYTRKRDLLFNGLKKRGLNPILPGGGYFILCKIDHLLKTGETDEDLCLRLIKDVGVATIPLSPFYVTGKPEGTYLRFCFAKKEATLEQALERLKKLN